MRLFEGVSLAFGPTTEGGFYYDFDLPEKISEEDFPKIEAEMRRIIKDKEPFERFAAPEREEARQLCEDLNQDLKVEHIETGLADQTHVSFYRQGRIRRPVPRTAYPQCREDQSHQGDEYCGVTLEG